LVLEGSVPDLLRGRHAEAAGAKLQMKLELAIDGAMEDLTIYRTRPTNLVSEDLW
jgi:hypothetical protein